MTNKYSIQQLDTVHLQDALRLVWDVFLEFEAPDYCEEGAREFKSFIAYDSIQENMLNNGYLMWGCYDGQKIVGVLATRLPCHISLLFVDKQYHRQGIARQLFAIMLDFYKSSGCTEITVNSSPYAREAYHRLGFVDTDTDQTVNGIRFVPMKYQMK